MARADTLSEAARASLLPLFYRSLEGLHSEVHGDWRLKEGDAGFTSETPFVPIVASELAAASRSYPIVFAADSTQPVAVLGLERRNLFVEEGRWAQDTYVPAYVRRYPFAFLRTADPEGFALSIDSGSDRVVQGGEEGMALFSDGEPSDLTRQALEFCAAFGRDAEMTTLFATALREQDLLIDRRADATLPDGRKLGLEGFQIVDAEKFAALDDETVLAWHRKGLLALVHFHLASLDRFNGLLERQARLSAAAPVISKSQTAASSEAVDEAADSAASPAGVAAPASVKTKKA